MLRAAVAAAALALSAAACSGDEPPGRTLPSITAAPSSTPSVPPLPAAAEGDDAAAASEFAKYYLALVDIALQTADSGVLTPYTDAGCGGCDALIKAADDLEAAGERLRGGAHEIASAVAPESEAGDYVVLIDYTRAASQVVDERDEVVRENDPVPATTSQMRVVREPGGWKVYGYRVVTA